MLFKLYWKLIYGQQLFYLETHKTKVLKEATIQSKLLDCWLRILKLATFFFFLMGAGNGEIKMRKFADLDLYFTNQNWNAKYQWGIRTTH